MQIQTLKGFRDFLGADARKRQYVMDTLRKVFESYGFEPLETPALEYDEILSGKYGEEGEKLMYRFEDNGGRKVAMRYDQTVPTSRFVAQNQNTLPFPFKRYQIQPVWRAENTQKGRYREFVQCDADIFGLDSAATDAEIIQVYQAGLTALGFKNTQILINDRANFEGLPTDAIIAIDKLKKISEEGVCQEMVDKGVTKSQEEAYNLLQSILQKKPTQRLEEIFLCLRNAGISQTSYTYSPTLARGLDYYTGLIFEIESPDYPVGSLGGGGRFNNLIGMFSKNQIPAVGFAVGFDRTLEAMEALNLFPEELNQASAKVLVTVFNPELEEKSLELSFQLRSKNINTELYLDPDVRMEKQLKYAIQKAIPYVVILGPEEVEKNVVTVKNLKTREQTTISFEKLLELLP